MALNVTILHVIKVFYVIEIGASMKIWYLPLFGLIMAGCSMFKCPSSATKVKAGGSYDGCNFSNYDLRNRNLTQTNFGNAQMTGVNLTGSNITQGYFKDANLTNANLTSVNGQFANFYGANLSGAVLESANFKSADFSNASLYKASGKKVLFNNADLSGAKWVNGKTCQKISVSGCQ